MNQPTQMTALMSAIALTVAIACNGEPIGSIDAADSGDARDASTDTRTDAGDDSGDEDAADAGRDARSATALVSPDAWEKTAEENDPFDDAPDEVECDEDAYEAHALEEGEDGLVVHSEGCNYLTVSQPALDDVQAGDQVYVRLYHFELNAPDGGEAHLAVATEDETIWEEFVPIPAEGDLLTHTWEATEPISKGDPLYFHFHNHGANEYYLLEISRLD